MSNPSNPAPTSAKTGNAFMFEAEACTRCGGGGEYSYCQSHGTRCFKCGGHGITVTKRGAEAQRFYRELLMVPAEQVQPGQKILNPGLPGFVRGGWATVNSVEMRDGKVHIDATMADGMGYGVTDFLGQAVRVAHDAEAKAAAKAEALAYQATLTKQGKPRKAAALAV